MNRERIAYDNNFAEETKRFFNNLKDADAYTTKANALHVDQINESLGWCPDRKGHCTSRCVCFSSGEFRVHSIAGGSPDGYTNFSKFRPPHCLKYHTEHRG